MDREEARAWINHIACAQKQGMCPALHPKFVRDLYLLADVPIPTKIKPAHTTMYEQSVINDLLKSLEETLFGPTTK